MTAAASSDPGPPLAIVEIPHEDDREQLRLALALNGGVSLAIWIGGVCMEIDRLVRAEGVWGEALELTQSTARADVMAGASAGGINGALLAMAQAHGQGLERLRRVWLDDASLDDLFRSPFTGDPPSLLKGDEYFLERLRKVFGELAASRSTDPKKFPIHLMITTTLLTGERQDFDDELGQTIHDVTHRGVFTFHRDEDEDDFRTPEDAERLALASRSTASFPGAFEASFVPVGGSAGAGRPDMSHAASFASSRFVVDGGVLVNKPVGPVLRHIFDMPAREQVRRVLAYVVPDPGVPPKPEPEEPDAIPSIAQVVASAVTLPRQESIALELEDVKEHNRKVEDLHRVRELLLSPEVRKAADVMTLARVLFKEYRRSRVDGQVGFFLAQLTVGTRQLDVEEGVVPDRFDRTVVAEALRVNLRARIAEAFPATGASLRRWPWNVKTVESLAAMVSELLRAALEVTPPIKEGERATYRETLQAHRQRLGELLRELEAIRREDIRYWRDEKRVRGFSTRGNVGPRVRKALQGWFEGPLKDLPRIPEEIARILAEAGQTLWAVCGACRAFDGEAVATLATKLEGLGVPKRTPGKTAHLPLLHRLLAMSVVQQGLTTGQAPIDQHLSLIQISADTENGLDQRSKASQKLAGIQLGHFGAFYKRSWRANDWMWGRLDGAQRLAQVVLNPERIRKLAQAAPSLDGGNRAEHVFRRIERLVLGPEGSDARPVLEERWDPEKARKELRLLFGEEAGKRAPTEQEHDEAKPPKRLEEAATALARRIQLEAVIDELPHIANSIEHDRAAGAKVSPGTADFMNAVRQAQPGREEGGRRTTRSGRIPPDRALQLFGNCEVGQERITDELGSDLLTNTASTAAAVAVSAARGKGSGMGPIRGLVGSLRGFTVALYLLARSATGRSGTHFAILLTLLATGGALLGFAVVSGNAPGPLDWVGLTLILAGLVVATARAGPWWVLVLFVSTLGLAVAPFLIGRLESDLWLVRLSRDYAEAMALGFIVLGSILLGFLSSRMLGWLPRDARLAAVVVGSVALGLGTGAAFALGWPPAALAAIGLVLGALLGWAFLSVSLSAVGSWIAAAYRAVAGAAVAVWAHRRNVAVVLAAVAVGAGIAVGIDRAVAALGGRLPAFVAFLVVGVAAGVGLRAWRRRWEAWVTVKPPAGSRRRTFVLAWGDGAGDGVAFDVQVRPQGRPRYSMWHVGQRDGRLRFRARDLPDGGSGRYEFRVRRRSLRTNWHWGWSRPVSVTITDVNTPSRTSPTPPSGARTPGNGKRPTGANAGAAPGGSESSVSRTGVR